MNNHHYYILFLLIQLIINVNKIWKNKLKHEKKTEEVSYEQKSKVKLYLFYYFVSFKINFRIWFKKTYYCWRTKNAVEKTFSRHILASIVYIFSLVSILYILWYDEDTTVQKKQSKQQAKTK